MARACRSGSALWARTGTACCPASGLAIAREQGSRVIGQGHAFRGAAQTFQQISQLFGAGVGEGQTTVFPIAAEAGFAGKLLAEVCLQIRKQRILTAFGHVLFGCVALVRLRFGWGLFPPGKAVPFPPVRGGTDGSRLSFMGLPCPNICTGGHNGHSRHEYVSVESLDKCTEILVHLAAKLA